MSCNKLDTATLTPLPAETLTSQMQAAAGGSDTDNSSAKDTVSVSMDLQQQLEAAMRQSVQVSASHDVSRCGMKAGFINKGWNGCIPKHWQTWSLFGTGLSLAEISTADLSQSRTRILGSRSTVYQDAFTYG